MAKPRVIAIEEHYWDPEIEANWPKEDRFGPPQFQALLKDLGEQRLKNMDEAGVDMQVLSQAAPATHKMPGELAVRLARGANDRLAESIKAHPNRYAAFATLPTSDPKGAADELERTVDKLGFKGGLVHGLTNGVFIDDKRFWPLFERAAALDVPIYLHPSMPDAIVVDRYYKDYVKDYPAILSAGWGFTVETATQGLRMVLSGVFDTYPKLKIVIGHLGEGLPFLLHRIDESFSRQSKIRFRDIFAHHVYVTTSGNFSTPALLCSLMELGVDRILFAIDYPFVANAPGPKWMEGVPLSQEDREKILHRNAEKLLGV